MGKNYVLLEQTSIRYIKAKKASNSLTMNIPARTIRNKTFYILTQNTNNPAEKISKNVEKFIKIFPKDKQKSLKKIYTGRKNSFK